MTKKLNKLIARKKELIKNLLHSQNECSKIESERSKEITTVALGNDEKRSIFGQKTWAADRKLEKERSRKASLVDAIKVIDSAIADEVAVIHAELQNKLYQRAMDEEEIYERCHAELIEARVTVKSIEREYVRLKRKSDRARWSANRYPRQFDAKILSALLQNPNNVSSAHKFDEIPELVDLLEDEDIKKAYKETKTILENKYLDELTKAKASEKAEIEHRNALREKAERVIRCGDVPKELATIAAERQLSSDMLVSFWLTKEKQAVMKNAN